MDMSAKVEEEKNDVETIKQILEGVIEEEDKQEVEIFEEILQRNFRILEKTREETHYKGEHLVSERNTAYRNLTEESTTYRFKTCYEEGSSLAMTTTSGITGGIGGILGVGYGPVKLGVGGGLKLKQEKSTSDDEHKSEINHHEVEVKVPKGKTVEIKKLVFCVPKLCVCKLELALHLEEKIKYFYKSAKTGDTEDSKKEGEVKVGKLRDKLIFRLKEHRNKSHECTKRGKMLLITFKRVCKFSVYEQRIETRILKKTEENKMAWGEIGRRIRVHSATGRSALMIDGNITADGPLAEESTGSDDEDNHKEHEIQTSAVPEDTFSM